MQKASYLGLLFASAILASTLPPIRVLGGEHAPVFVLSGERQTSPEARPFGPVWEGARDNPYASLASAVAPAPQLPIRKPPMPAEEGRPHEDAKEAAAIAAAPVIRLARLDPALPDVSRKDSDEARPASRFGILGSFEFKTANRRYAAAWADVLARIESERPLYLSCGADNATECSPAMRGWREALESWRGLPPEEQILELNRFANHAVPYADDAKAYASRDHWASPLEFLKASGDCEDYAIFKFVSLLDLGFTSDQLRIAIVKQKRKRDLHAVVTVRVGAEIFVLDNLFDHPVGHEYVLRYMPVSSFNLDSHWAHVVTNQIRAKFLNEVEAKLARKDAARSRAGHGA